INDSNTKFVADQKEWSIVSKELEDENIKLAYYDHTLIPLLGNVGNKKILDYGAGPGVLALALKKLGANVKVYDINPEMAEKAGQKIGSENVYNFLNQIPKDHFDLIINNLVLCIVPEQEVRDIVLNIAYILNENGLAYIGFCNPLIFNIPESNLDFRFPTGNKYEDNHNYKKIKKEGGYEIIESHRPIEWYEQVFEDVGLNILDKIFTPEYELKGSKIKDFIIFKLQKNG